MARFETWFSVNLNKAPQVQTIHGNVFTQDNMGNLVGVRVMKGNAEATLTGTVLGYVIREDGKTVVVNGERSGNTAYIVLPESAYAVPGRIQIAIRLISGSTKTVLLAAIAYVTRTTTGTIIDPGEVIPSLEELLAKLDEMDDAIAAARQATDDANAAARGADNAASGANAAAQDATAAASNAAARMASMLSCLGPVYNANTIYHPNDYAVYNDQLYQRIGNGTTQNTAPTNTTYWEIVTVAGELSDIYDDAFAQVNDAIMRLFNDIPVVTDYDSTKTYSYGDLYVNNNEVWEYRNDIMSIKAHFDVGDLINYHDRIYRCAEDTTGSEELIIVDENDYYFSPYLFVAATIKDMVESVTEKEFGSITASATQVTGDPTASFAKAGNHFNLALGIPKGDTGIGVASVKIQHYLSTSAIALTDGVWSDDIPEYDEGCYYWARTVTTLSDNSIVNGTAYLDNALNDTYGAIAEFDEKEDIIATKIDGWFIENNILYLTANGVVVAGEDGSEGISGIGGLEDMAAILPVTTVSGPEVSFADAMEGLPLKSLVVEIDPVQEGSGTPSAENVRPITGRTGLRVQFPAQNGEELTKDWQKLRVYGPRKYPVGSQITVGAYDGKDLVWDVVDYGTKVDPSTGAARPCVTLLLHNLIPSHEFDTKEKFYYVDESVFPSGMPAGTYHFTCQGRTSPKTADNGVDFQFTLQYGISVGGYIMLDTSFSSNLNGSYLRVRATATAGYDRERAQITVGSEGTYLGTSDGNTPFMNQIMRAMGGSNMYAESNVRQWLNATGGPNAWWQANDLFDQPPTYPQFAGFLHDMDSDFVDAVAVTNVSCRANSAYVRPGYTTNSVYTVADKFFLPSRDEMGLGADGVAEGTVWAMYDGTDAASLRRKDTNQNQCNWLLRSPYPSTVASIRYVNTRGVISNAESFCQFAVSPACVLWLEMEETLDIDFPEAAGTVYGGTLDVVQGVLKVTKGYIESYQLTSIPSGWMSSMDEYSPQKTIPTRGAQVVYDLDAPQVYALAPHAIKVVPGSNQYRADSGDVRVTYSMTIAGYVEKKLAELRAELEADEDLDTVNVELNE